MQNYLEIQKYFLFLLKQTYNNMSNQQELSFRLEFNESQQFFHHCTHNRHQPNTNGWKTIMNNCTDYQFRLIESYINRIPNKIHTVKSIKNDIIELQQFIKNLSEYEININKPEYLCK